MTKVNYTVVYAGHSDNRRKNRKVVEEQLRKGFKDNWGDSRDSKYNTYKGKYPLRTKEGYPYVSRSSIG